MQRISRRADEFYRHFEQPEADGHGDPVIAVEGAHS